MIEESDGHDGWADFRGMPAEITNLLRKESDRGAILIVAAYLDEILGLIVRSACVSENIGKEILEFRQPAGDFSSRIIICEAFGLIHQEEAKALHQVRKIRNNAAHFERRGRGFEVLVDSPSTADQVVALATVFGLEPNSKRRIAVRRAFVLASRFLAIRLYMRGLDATRPKSSVFHCVSGLSSARVSRL